MTKKQLTLIIALLAIAFGAYILLRPPGKTITVDKIVYIDKAKGDTIKVEKSDTNSLTQKFSTLGVSQLPINLITEMVNNYRNNQLASIESSTINSITKDAHSIWFELDTLKKFIYNIEQGVINNKRPNSKLGIRMYYAAYPENLSAYPVLKDLLNDPLKKQYGKLHTLVMLPTINISGGNYDFNPIDINSYIGLSKMKNQTIEKSAANKNLQKTIALTAFSAVQALNHGQLIPPLPTDTDVEAF